MTWQCYIPGSDSGQCAHYALMVTVKAIEGSIPKE